MRLSSLAMRLCAFAIAAVLCFFAAQQVVAVVETRSATAVQQALLDNDHDWASVQADGLQVVIEGEAPSEVDRFRAISAAGKMVDSSRVIDNMSIADSDIDTAPDFAIEMLRNDDAVTLIGLIPVSSDEGWVMRRVGRFADEAQMTDLVDSVEYAAPDGWAAALVFALDALEMMPRSKISLTSGGVAITAMADSAGQKTLWSSTLRRNAPDGVKYRVDITAPRPVFTPFTVRFISQGDTVRFDACAADDETAQAKIIAAAIKAGADAPVTCPLGLGAPSVRWGDAVAQSIDAIVALGGGTLTVTDGDIRLVAIEGTDQAQFDDVVGQLDNGLPDLFSLTAVLPQPPDPQEEGPPEFTITRSPEGLVQMRGRVADDLANMTAENYAKARFGHDNVDMRTRVVADNLPANWSVRVLAGVEALASLHNGAVVVQPDNMTVSGRTGIETAQADISRLLIDKLGQGAAFDLNITYDVKLDPIAGLPTPQECVDQIVGVTAKTKITFEPGSAKIVAGARGAMDDIAEILRECPDLPLRIAGYTDSQGRDEMNLQLSQQRADAVLSGLRTRRIPVSSFTAVGYGEENPIADNKTAAGREANRRIEFSLIPQDAAAPDTKEESETGDEQN